MVLGRGHHALAGAGEAATTTSAVDPPGTAPSVRDEVPREAGAGSSNGAEQADELDGAGNPAPVDRTEPAPHERLVARSVLALVLLPVVVSGVALVVGVGGDYMPAADHALTELQIRDVGRHEVLKGLYSRADWSHPGPALFYLLAPFYWLTGGASVGMHLGALAINGGAVAGMVVLARRRGGLALMLCLALSTALMLRMVGAEFVADPWNCYVTVLPFGLLVLLAWSAASGDRWALPVAAGVATYLAQAHVGFVVLALPLLGWAVLGLARPAWRSGDAARRRDLVRPALVGLAVLAVMWLPPLLDVLFNAPSNLRNIVEWFGEGEGGTKTPLEGWRVVTAQFGVWPEWLTVKRDFSMIGESPFLVSAPLPWLLVPVVAAGVVMWRRGGDDRRLAATLALVFVLSVVAVARTVGLAFDYRLRWTWILPMLALAATAWMAWRLAVERWRRAEVRWLVPVALAALVAVTGVNTFTAATYGRPHGGDSTAMDAVMPPTLAEVGDLDGPVVVTDVFDNGAWFQRGVVLQLERHGVDARVPPQDAELFGRHRAFDGRPDARLVVAEEHGVEVLAARPGYRLLADWWDEHITPDDVAEAERRMAEVTERHEDGEIDAHEELARHRAIDAEMREGVEAVYYRVAVFLEEATGGATTEP